MSAPDEFCLSRAIQMHYYYYYRYIDSLRSYSASKAKFRIADRPVNIMRDGQSV